MEFSLAKIRNLTNTIRTLQPYCSDTDKWHIQHSCHILTFWEKWHHLIYLRHVKKCSTLFVIFTQLYGRGGALSNSGRPAVDMIIMMSNFVLKRLSSNWTTAKKINFMIMRPCSRKIKRVLAYVSWTHWLLYFYELGSLRHIM